MVFLDPEPRRFHNTARKRNTSGSSAFFSAQRPLENPRNSHGNRYAWRKPLEERSQSQNNRQVPRAVPRSPAKSTVRIVQESPTVVAADKLDKADFDLKTPSVDKITDGGYTAEHVLAPTPRQSESREAKPANVRDPGSSVSHAPRPANELDSSHSDALLASSVHARGSRAWHRRSGSTGNFSTSSTLKEGDSSLVGGQSVGSRSRLSLGTTLRGTPTPYEHEHSEHFEAEGRGQALQTLEEASPERSTVRVVPEPASSESESTHQHRDSQATQSSPVVRLLGTPPSTESRLGSPSPPRRSSRRTSSTGSLPSVSHLRDISIVHYPRAQSSQDSLAASEASLPRASSPNFAVFPSELSIPPSSIPPSSPNFVAFYSDASRPRSRSHPLRGVSSYDSIASRLQPSSRPGTGSAAYHELSSSTDTLPPLQLPKKRLRSKPGSASLRSAEGASGAQGSNMVTEEEIDTLPYPRYQFSSHLSTIASESDQVSRRSSVPLSHFSLGSGVLTIDDASSIPLSSRRRGSAPIESVISSQEPDASSGEHEEAGDMTLGLYREESAKPQPLFESKRYDGPLPPLPPIPPSRDSDENFDTVSELQAPVLREQRSGYSLRTRSNSTPSRSQSRRSQSHSRHLSQISYVESDRGSHGSSIFPVWAKQFYKNNVPLASSSKISLGPYPPPRPGNPHLRNDSNWTERSITSRLGTGYSEIDNASPTSSHFLPSIFRPRTRGRSNPGKKPSHKGHQGRPSADDGSRPDSMAIFADPGEPLSQDPNAETTAAGQPRYGALKDDTAQQGRRPLPRKYSKQKQWNEMTFPRPMTKDRLSDFGLHTGGEPRLGPSKRVSNRLSVWRAPSFVESLDSLVRSRANRQILLFALGFVMPLSWMLAAVLPIPKKPVSASELEKSLGGSEDDVAAAMMKHEAGDAEKRWQDEKLFLKARWWRSLNRIMSVVGLLVIGAVIALAVVATTR